MKRHRNNRKMWITIAIVVCVVFVVGIGAVSFLSNRTPDKTQSADLKDKGQGGSTSSKNDTVSKDDADSSNSGKGDSANSDSDTNADSGNGNDSGNGSNTGSTNGNQNSQNTDNGTQSNAQGSTASTYDASAPADSTAIHRYDYILSDCTWQEAFQDCINKGGYLVRINTPEEYEYIRKEISKKKMTDVFFRIGGRRDPQSRDYYWVNQNNKLFGDKLNAASSWCSDEWMKNEPSFQDGNVQELYMDLFFSDEENRFVWNDVPDNMLQTDPAYSGKLGYICEYE